MRHAVPPLRHVWPSCASGGATAALALLPVPPAARADIAEGPTVYTFDLHPEPGADFSSSDSRCSLTRLPEGGFDNGAFLRIPCPENVQPRLVIRFDEQPRALVELFLRRADLSGSPDQIELTA